MAKTFILLALCAAMLVIGGCASPSSSANLSANAQIQKRLDEIFDAAMRKDMPRLDSYHAYGPGFTKFSGQLGRLDAAAAREGEHHGLLATTDLSMKAADLKIDVFNRCAIATFILDYGFKTGTERIDKQDRATLVFVKEGAEWKITHEHLSPYKP
jgi:ketosteroid isomerase-like protein